MNRASIFRILPPINIPVALANCGCLRVNVPRVRVSAKLFTGEAVPVAVKAFDKYEERPEDSDESYTRIDAEALPGKVIWEKEFAPTARWTASKLCP